MDLHLPHFNHCNQLLVHKLPTILLWERLGLEKIVCLRLKARDSVPNKYIFFEYPAMITNSIPFHRRVTTQAHEIVHLYARASQRFRSMCDFTLCTCGSRMKLLCAFPFGTKPRNASPDTGQSHTLQVPNFFTFHKVRRESRLLLCHVPGHSHE